ncbi:type II secretion system inner membrane protein GspF [Brachymonas sp. G13]|uniref:type II secretion system inner membrane protein GspF n=1 Tax=Brachymonas wangyanguii TaxID=3130163 RepID=UPI0016B0DF5E|nr:type II secretion system inner membrane protein GspF [Ramlibacter sp.]
MPVYQYQALDANGRTRKGTLEADTLKAARTAVRARELVPLEVKALQGDAAQRGSGLNRQLFVSKIFDSTTLAVWTRQLAGLVSAGLPVERALQALSEDAAPERQRQLVGALRSEVHAGSSFAKALQQHPREFTPIYTAVIAAGEQSGSLGMVLLRLADDLEAQQELKSKVTGAALYPAIVSLVAVAIVIFLLSYVVPQVAGVYAGSKRALPVLTTIMLAFSDLIRQWGWLLALLLLGGGLLLRQLLKGDAFRQRFDAWWLKLPVVGPLSCQYNAARFAGTLAMLSQAGVPILRALQAATATLSNRAMQVDAEDVIVLVREGAPLGSALSQKSRFPKLIGMFARLGEQTGQLGEMLGRVARQLSGEVQRRAMRLATVLEPLLIVGMGLVVMLIVLAVLMPIMELNQLTG